MAKKVIKFLDNLSPSEFKLKDLPRKNGLYNLHFNSYGQLVKRAGYSEYNTTPIDVEPSDPEHKIVGVHRFYKQDTAQKEFIVAWNQSLYKLPDAGEHTPAALTNCPTLIADADTHFYDIYNHCYILNGENAMMKYDRSNVRLAGVDPPALKPTSTGAVPSGNLTAGDYYVCYTYVDEDDREGNASPVSAKITASTNDKIPLTMVISNDAKVTKHRIYRTIADGAIYYFDKEIAEATSVDLTQADSTLGQGTVLHTDHTAPVSAPQLGTKRRSRAYIAKDGIVYISNLTKPEYFPLVKGQYIWTGNEQKVTGMLEQLTGLPVFTDDSIERLLGTDKDNFEFKNSYATEGCIATRSLVNCDNLLVYLEFDGTHYFDGVSTGIFSEALNEYIKANINDTYAYLSCGTYFNDKYLLCYPKGSSATPSETIYYDFVTKTYGIYSFDFSCFSKWARGTDGLRLFGGSNIEGRVYEIFKADGTDILADDGSAITAYDRIEPLNMGKPEVWKQFHNIYIKVKTTTGTALTMYYTLDDASETSKSLTMTADSTLWYKIDLVSGQKARAISLRPYISDKYAFTIMGLAIVYEEEAPEY